MVPTDAETGKGGQPETNVGGLSHLHARENLGQMSKRKPLEVVRVVRARAVDDAARTLREAEERAARAREVEEEARRREAEARAEARARTEQEVTVLSKGASARDFAQIAAFAVGNERAIERAREQSRAAEAKSKETKSAAERSRGTLIEAKTSLEVVEKHQASARKREDEAAAARLDEVAEDAFAARFKS